MLGKVFPLYLDPHLFMLVRETKAVIPASSFIILDETLSFRMNCRHFRIKFGRIFGFITSYFVFDCNLRIRLETVEVSVRVIPILVSEITKRRILNKYPR